MTRTLCLVAAWSMLALSGCRPSSSEVPMLDSTLFFQPDEVNPFPMVTVQVVKPADATSLAIQFSHQARVYTRTLINLPAGTFFTSDRAATFFNAPDLTLRAGERFSVEATFLKANGDKIAPPLTFEGNVSLSKLPGTVLFVVKNDQ